MNMAEKYVSTPETVPQGGSRHHGTERPKYPSTCTFASEKDEFDSHLSHCMTARRPGGEYRKGHGFKTIGSSSGHPVKSGTEEAKKHIIHCNIQE
jgi:hypothetical protein